MKQIKYIAKIFASISLIACGLSVNSYAQQTDEIVDMGYTKQSRNSISGAVSTISGEELEKQPVANLTQKLTGKATGLTVMEYNSELSRSSAWMMIRGISTINGRQPIVMIDGVICPNTNFDYITPEEIEAITILKDGSSTAIFGIQGANGVIVITTKRGFDGQTKVGVNIDNSFQQMTKRPSFTNAARYAELRNEAGQNDGLGSYSQFPQSDIDNYRSGVNRELYPNNDFYNMFLKEFSTMQRAGINIRGGNSKIMYYSNINFMNQGLPYKVAQKEKYDPTPTNYWINYRTNVDAQITPYLKGFMSLSGNIKREKTAGYGNSTIYAGLFNLPPTMYGPLSPVVVDPLDPTNITGGQVTTHDREDFPVYGMINRSGYAKHIVTNIISQAGLDMDMSFLTQGLSLSGVMAYQTNSVNSTYTLQDFERWVRTADMSQLEFVKKGGNTNSSLNYSKNRNFYYNLNFLAKADYSRKFGLHAIDAMAYVYYLQQDKESWNGGQAGMMQYKRQSLGVTANYGYNDTYFAKFDLGYSGSDQFHSDKRFVATPAISAAWVASNEEFLSELDWLSYLKVRASYGVTANDQLGYEQRFLYLDDFRAGNSYDGLRGNPNIEAEKIKKQNYGIDVGLLRELTLSFDYYRHLTDNMLISPTGMIPDYQGIPSQYYAKTNGGKMENNGFELSATYTKKIDADWSVFANVGFSSNKNKIIDIKEAPSGSDYAYAYRNTGYSIGQQWGYVIDTSNGNGYFNSQSELDNSGLTYTFGTPRVGDFIYKDLNGDNLIDQKDEAPIGNSWFPKHTYSMTAGFSYKNLDFSFMFQGVGKVSEAVSGVGFYENSLEGVYNDIHQHAWTAERYAAGEKIDYPALSLGASTSLRPNSYFIMDRSFVRLKNVEIGYTLPDRTSKAISANKIRFTLRGQNLFTFDKMKTDYVDPETGSLNRVQPYRIYSAGVNLTF